MMLVGLSFCLALVAFILIYGVQLAAPWVPFHYEQKLAGKIFLEETALESELNSKRRAQMALVKRLGAELTHHADLPEGMLLNFHLMEADDMPNAFATLGGHIMVTTALIEEVSSENALAMVLAHEIAHVKHRHPLKALSGGMTAQLLMSLVLGNHGAGALQAALGQAGALTVLSFSRGMESDADQEALAILQAYYGHLGGADEFFKNMLKAHGQAGWREMFDTHPDVARRLRVIQTAIAEQDNSEAELVPLK